MAVKELSIKGKIFTVFAGLFILLVGGAVGASAQVKRIEMHIGGYLCGN